MKKLFLILILPITCFASPITVLELNERYMEFVKSIEPALIITDKLDNQYLQIGDHWYCLFDLSHAAICPCDYHWWTSD